MVVEMKDNRDEYGGGGDVVRQLKRCGMTDMVKWVGRSATDWANIDRDNLRAYRRSDNLGTGAMIDLHSDLLCIWRLCVSYCNLNKITC